MVNKKQKNALIKHAVQKRATRNLSAGLTPGSSGQIKKPAKITPKERREAEKRGERQAKNSPASKEPFRPDEPIKARQNLAGGNLGKHEHAFVNKEAIAAEKERQRRRRKHRRILKRRKEKEIEREELTPGGSRGFDFAEHPSKA